MPSSLRVLAVATKSPWPPVGGGSLALHTLLTALIGAGMKVSLIAPGPAAADDSVAGYRVRVVPAAPRSWRAVAPHLAFGLPATIARFRIPLLARAVEDEVASFAPDVLHVEQLHLAWLLPSLVPVLPVVLRQQNVESLLLRRVARLRRAPLSWLLRREATRVAEFEARACLTAHAVAAISDVDAARLRELSPGASVATLPVPFAATTPAAGTRLAGDPPLVALGSFDWAPNRDGMTWFLQAVWPLLHRLVPGAVLHLAGPGSDALVSPDRPAIVRHGVVARTDELYDPRSIVLVPLRAGSGVRLRIVEAWAAGIPVVTTAIGGEGLVTVDGDGAALAETPHAFALAVAALAADGSLRSRLVARGREHLQDHDPGKVAALARNLYRQAIEAAGRRRP